MSATNRSERGGEGLDYFPTPAWCVDWLLGAVRLPGGPWLEPSAGDGAIIRAVNARRADVLWDAVEIRQAGARVVAGLLPKAAGVYWQDFLMLGSGDLGAYNVILGNPPFLLAERFVAHSLTLAPIVVFLLRLNFLGAKKRADFWRRHPADVYVLSERPSFDGEGTDATEYAWFVWGQCGTVGTVRVLSGDAAQLPLLGTP